MPSQGNRKHDHRRVWEARKCALDCGVKRDHQGPIKEYRKCDFIQHMAASQTSLFPEAAHAENITITAKDGALLEGSAGTGALTESPGVPRPHLPSLTWSHSAHVRGRPAAVPCPALGVLIAIWPSGAQQPMDPREQGKKLKGPLQQPQDGDVRVERGNKPHGQIGKGEPHSALQPAGFGPQEGSWPQSLEHL